MKTLLLVLCLVLAVVGLALFQSSRGKASQLQTARADTTRLSNEMSQALLKIQTLEVVQRLGQSNALAQEQALQALSNRWARLRAEFTQAQADTATARRETQSREQRLAEWEAAAEAWTQTSNQLHGQSQLWQEQSAGLQARLNAVERARAALQEELNGARRELAEWTQRFNDPAVLRVRLAALNGSSPAPVPASEPARRDASSAGSPGASVSSATAVGAKELPATSKKKQPLKLELQADGSVRLVPASDLLPPAQP